MLNVPSLNLGSVDAINYKTRGEHEFLAQILYREDYLESILKRQKYFLIGEKGTGKTAYAVFLNNADYNNTLSTVINLTENDYRHFVVLSQKNPSIVPYYVDVWRFILLLLVCNGIADKLSSAVSGYPKFSALKAAIDEYYHSSFRPEVDQSLDMVENAVTAAEMISRHAGPAALPGSMSLSSLQVTLSFLERKLREAISSLKLPRDFIMFVDGIDIRPDLIDYQPYLSCIRGLANAVWELNTQFFSNIRDTPKHVKIVTLMRPDILDNMGFQNLNARVQDNGVVLDWVTTYERFRNSSLFHLVAGTISKQQNVKGRSDFDVWKHYFPYEYENLRVAEKKDDPFVGLLRYSFYRPRDIVRYLQFMQDYVTREEENKKVFSRESFFGRQRDFSEYLLGEVKDYLGFYHSTVAFDEVVGFFGEFGGENVFSWQQLRNAFERNKARLEARKIEITEMTSSAEDLLQFLYSLNMVGYQEPDGKGGNFVHYCFRDRTPVKLRPNVRFGLTYQVHPGLQRALLVGGKTRMRKRRRRGSRSKREA
jgi:hypothetical protein